MTDQYNLKKFIVGNEHTVLKAGQSKVCRDQFDSENQSAATEPGKPNVPVLRLLIRQWLHFSSKARWQETSLTWRKVHHFVYLGLLQVR